MTTALVLGGTRFIGRQLVHVLRSAGVRVTVATRGNWPVPNWLDVELLFCDRTDSSSLTQAVGNRHFDLVFDQVAYQPEDVVASFAALGRRVGRYVLTSSIAVYTNGTQITEECFNPLTYRYDARIQPDYAEGKRRVEANLVGRAPFPTAIARLPTIIGPGDPAGRVQRMLKQLRQGRPTVIPWPRGRRSYASVEEAGAFVAWLGLAQRDGPYNIGSPTALDAAELTQLAGALMRLEAPIAISGPAADCSPFYNPDDLVVDVLKAELAGFRCQPIKAWLEPALRAAESCASIEASTQ